MIATSGPSPESAGTEGFILDPEIYNSSGRAVARPELLVESGRMAEAQ